jgi:hypothetical protein
MDETGRIAKTAEGGRTTRGARSVSRPPSQPLPSPDILPEG